MSVQAAVSVPARDFLLGETLNDGADVQLRVNVVIPTGEAAIPYLWVSNIPADQVERTLGSDPDVRVVDVVERNGDIALAKVRWRSVTAQLLELLVESNAILAEALGNEGSWSLSLRFPDQEELAEFYQRCTDRGITMTVESVDTNSWDGGRSTLPLTDLQKEALRTAFETGYFEVPRDGTLVDLAEELGVSDSAVSQRLRRGIASLVESTVVRREPVEDR